MSKILEKFNKDQQKNLPEIMPGDTIKVHQKIKEGNKERIQIFQGIVIAKKHGKGISATITVRKVTGGVGVERIFPIHSPSIEKIEIVKRVKVRRAKLYYLREAKGRKAKLKKKDFSEAITPEEEPIVEELAPKTVDQEQADIKLETVVEEKPAEEKPA